MTETEQRKLPVIIDTPVRWIHRRWNETRYGFPDGKPDRERMDELLNQERLGWKDVSELSSLIRRTSNARLIGDMSEKVGEGVHQLVIERKPRQMDVLALSDFIDRTAREEGLE